MQAYGLTAPGHVLASAPMKRFAALALLMSTLATVLTGCVGSLDGRTKASAIPFKKDTITDRYERSVQQGLAASRVVLGRLGQITSDDAVLQTVTGRVSENYVYVRVLEVDPKTIEIATQVRTRGGNTDIDMTAEISKQIALQLATMR
jgi:hypothetical protein